MTKTEFMLIGSSQRLSTLTDSPTPAINGAPISYSLVTTAKSLCSLMTKLIAAAILIN